MSEPSQARGALPTPTPTPPLLTTKEVASMLAICERKLFSMRSSAELRCIRIGRSVRYDPREVAAFLERQRDRRTPWKGG